MAITNTYRLNLKLLTTLVREHSRYLPQWRNQNFTLEEMIIYNLQLSRNIPEPLIFNITVKIYF